MPWPDTEPKVTDEDIAAALDDGKRVLLIASDRVEALRLASVHHGAMVVQAMGSLRGYRFDMIVYDLPRFTRFQKLMAFADWVNLAVRTTLLPGGVEGDYAGVEPDARP